jgi:hypothetical protein
MTPAIHHPALAKKTIVQAVAGLALVALAFAALALSDVSTSGTAALWSGVVAVYGLVSAALEYWYRSSSRSLGRRVAEVALHWFGVLVAIHLVYFFVGTGRMANADTGLTSALIIALGAYTAGIQGNWRFTVVGGVVAAGTLAAAWIEQYLWVFAGLGILSLVVLIVGSRRRRAVEDGAA